MVIHEPATPAKGLFRKQVYGGILLTCLWILATTVNSAAAEDFYSLDHTFVFSGLKDCKDNEYYDPVQFTCKRCESSFNLVPSKDSECCFIIDVL